MSMRKIKNRWYAISFEENGSYCVAGNDCFVTKKEARQARDILNNLKDGKLVLVDPDELSKLRRRVENLDRQLNVVYGGDYS